MSLPYYLKIEDGYLEYSQYNNPVVFAACMPWGTPFGLFATKIGADQACNLADQTPELVTFREQNHDLGLTWKYGPCHSMPLNLPTLINLTGINGKVVKNSQVYALLQSEVGVLEREVPSIKQDWIDRYTIVDPIE